MRVNELVKSAQKANIPWTLRKSMQRSTIIQPISLVSWLPAARGMGPWQNKNKLYTIIIRSKYFPVSDWLKQHAYFTITSCSWPNLERILSYWTDDVKSAGRCRLLNRWLQNDVKSAAHCRRITGIELMTSYCWRVHKIFKNKAHFLL